MKHVRKEISSAPPRLRNKLPKVGPRSRIGEVPPVRAPDPADELPPVRRAQAPSSRSRPARPRASAIAAEPAVLSNMHQVVRPADRSSASSFA